MTAERPASGSHDATGWPPARELWLTGALAAGVLVAAALAFYGVDIATGTRLFFTHDIQGSDLWHLNYPMKHFYAAGLREGRLPLWCPEIGTGFPLHAEGQVAALYPPNLLLFGLLPLALAFNWGLLLHTVLAGVFAAMFARHVGAGRAGSVLAAVVFAFAGFFVTHLKHINMTATAVWGPVLLLLLERQAATPRLRTLALVAVTVGVMILAGHPQIAYQNLLVAGGYAAFLLVRVWRRPRAAGGGAWRFAGGVAYAVALGVLLGLPQILPTAELNRFSARRGGLPIEKATEFEYRYEHLLAFLLPRAFGDPGALRQETVLDPATGRPYANPTGGAPPFRLRGFDHGPRRTVLFWEITGYVGLLPLGLAAAAAVLGFRRRRVRALLVLLGASLLLVLGKHGGLFYLLYHLPLYFDRFRFHDRFLLQADLALAVLAGIGLTLLIERLPPIRRRALGRLVAAAAVLIAFADLRVALGDHNPKIDTARWTAPPASVQRIRRQESKDGTPFRIADNDQGRQVFTNAYYRARGWHGDLSPYDPARLMLNPNLNLLHDLTNLHIYYQLMPRWMWDASMLFYLRPDPRTGLPRRVNEKIVSLFNIRYLLDFAGALVGTYPVLETYPGDVWLQPVRLGPPDDPDPVLLASPPYTIRLHKNPAALPRAFLVPRARAVLDAPHPPGTFSAPQRALLSGRFDPRREVLITESPGEARSVAAGAPGPPIDARVTFVEYSPHRVHLAFTAPRDAWLFLSDTCYPGWHATLDGHALPIRRANITGRAVHVPAGRHDVVFSYAPRSFHLGLLGALLAVALLATLGVQRSLARRLAGAGPRVAAGAGGATSLTA